MTKTGKVAKLNKLNPGPFVEVHPDDAEALGIAEGDQVELTSRRGRAVLPAVVTDRVRPGNCFAPFHWNDEHGEYLAINAVTSDAVDPVSLQPEFKVCAVRLRCRSRRDTLRPRFRRVGARAAERRRKALPGRLLRRPRPTACRRPGAPGRRRRCAPRSGCGSTGARRAVLAGRRRRCRAPRGARSAGAVGVADRQRRGVRAQAGGDRLDGPRLLAMNDADRRRSRRPRRAHRHQHVRRRRAARQRRRLLGPPRRAGRPAPGRACGTRCSASATGPTTTSAATRSRSTTRLAELGARPAARPRRLRGLRRRADRPQWADRMRRPGRRRPTAAGRRPTPTAAPRRSPGRSPRRAPAVAQHPADAAAARPRRSGSSASTSPSTTSATPPATALGRLPRNDPAAVDAWLAATGLDGDRVVVVDGAEVAMRDALTSHATTSAASRPNLLRLPRRPTADRRSRPSCCESARPSCDAWLVGRNGVDLVARVRGPRPTPRSGRTSSVRLTPRLYSISSSPLVSPHEVQLTVRWCATAARGGAERGGVCSTFLADRGRATRAGVPAAVAALPAARRCGDADDHGRARAPASPRSAASFRSAARWATPGRNWLFFGDQHRHRNFYYRDDLERHGSPTDCSTGWTWPSPATSADGSMCSTRCSSTAPTLWRWLQDGAHLYVCGDASRMAKDVDDALTTIIGSTAGCPQEAAHDYKRELVADQAICARRVLTVATIKSPSGRVCGRRAADFGTLRTLVIFVKTPVPLWFQVSHARGGRQIAAPVFKIGARRRCSTDCDSEGTPTAGDGPGRARPKSVGTTRMRREFARP